MCLQEETIWQGKHGVGSKRLAGHTLSQSGSRDRERAVKPQNSPQWPAFFSKAPFLDHLLKRKDHLGQVFKPMSPQGCFTFKQEQQILQIHFLSGMFSRLCSAWPVSRLCSMSGASSALSPEGRNHSPGDCFRGDCFKPTAAGRNLSCS